MGGAHSSCLLFVPPQAQGDAALALVDYVNKEGMDILVLGEGAARGGGSEHWTARPPLLVQQACVLPACAPSALLDGQQVLVAQSCVEMGAAAAPLHEGRQPSPRLSDQAAGQRAERPAHTPPPPGPLHARPPLQPAAAAAR